MSAVSGSWQGLPSHTTTPLDQLKKEVTHEANQQIAGTNLGMLSEERADFLMRLDKIKAVDAGITEHDKPAYTKVLSDIDESIRNLRSTESLQPPAESPSPAIGCAPTVTGSPFS